jgi:outer membrane cobalamin receptor
MPTLSEMFTFFQWENENPAHKPEKSMQYTMGYQQTLEEKTFMSLSVYYYDVKDLILYRDNGYINRENAKHYGTEIRLNSSYFDKNALRFSYAYTHTRDSEREDLELIPLHQVKIEDTLRLSAKLNAYLGYQYIGSRYSANSATYSDEQIKLSGYHLLDAQLAYTFSPEIEGRAGIKNMLDEAYEWEYGYPTRGRSYYVSLAWKL